LQLREPMTLSIFHKNFKLLFSIILCWVISFKSTSQSIKKMPDNNWWTLSNLNLDIPNSYCYNDSTMHCKNYGRLYTWEAAQKGCRLLGKGWHLPSTAEWNQLLQHVGGAFVDSVNNGKDAYEKLLDTKKLIFGATLAGNRNPDGTYSRIGAHGFYWTSTVVDDSHAGFLNFALGKNALFLQPDMEKNSAISVRCIKNSK